MRARPRQRPFCIALVSLPLLSCMLWACPLAHDDPEPTKCYSDEDCFTAEKEYCDLTEASGGEPGVCKPYLDAAVKLDKGPKPDLPVIEDGGVDLPDAGPAPDGDAGGTVDTQAGQDQGDQDAQNG